MALNYSPPIQNSSWKESVPKSLKLLSLLCCSWACTWLVLFIPAHKWFPRHVIVTALAFTWKWVRCCISQDFPCNLIVLWDHARRHIISDQRSFHRKSLNDPDWVWVFMGLLIRSHMRLTKMSSSEVIWNLQDDLGLNLQSLMFRSGNEVMNLVIALGSAAFGVNLNSL